MKKVIVFGSSGDTGKSVINILKAKMGCDFFFKKNTKDRKNIKLNFDSKIEFENKISQVFKKNKYKYNYKLHRFGNQLMKIIGIKL